MGVDEANLKAESAYISFCFAVPIKLVIVGRRADGEFGPEQAKP